MVEDIDKLKEEFERIVNKYKLNKGDRAIEVSKYLVTTQKVDLKEFASLYAMEVEEARIFLSFIQAGLKFKEEHIDKK